MQHLEKFKHDFKQYKRNYDVPDADFNPARNEAVINEAIQEATQYHRTIGKAYSESLGERFEVLAYYGDQRLNRGSKKTLKQYLGTKAYEALIGERLLQKVRVAKTVNRFGRIEKPIML